MDDFDIDLLVRCLEEVGAVVTKREYGQEGRIFVDGKEVQPSEILSFFNPEINEERPL